MSIQTLTAPRVGVLAVDVVDGNGEGVSGETVEAVYRLADGSRARSRSVTDAGGRACFVDELGAAPQSVVLSAAGESIGPVELAERTSFVIET